MCTTRKIIFWPATTSLYSLENDYLEEASKAFELIHERFPRCPEPFWGAARLAVAQGRWNEAVRVLQELVADNPDNTDALIALANCLEKTGDLSRSPGYPGVIKLSV